ncbi:hypothetical protein PENTCL1PPCAC_23584, partial [Pristionchus entomophagus]
TGPSHSNDVKLYEAPATWKKFPNACRRVTTAVVRSSEFHDFDRLFSALIRIVRREMTFNEASASHHISLNLIKKTYKKISAIISAVIMRLMKDKKNDMELKGDEMDENGFQFDHVSDKSLLISINEKGEEYAMVDSSIFQLKKSRMNPSVNPNESLLLPPEPLPIPPSRRDIKKEEIYPVNEPLLTPHKYSPLPDETTFVNHINPGIDYTSLEVVFKNEDDEDNNELKMDRKVKDEPINDFYVNDTNDDSLLIYNMNQESMEEDDSRMKMEKEETQSIESPEGEDVPSTADTSFGPSNGNMSGKAFDSLYSKRIQKMENSINLAITNSWKYEEERSEQLKAAISAVCNKELRSADASIKFDISVQTLHRYVQRVHLLLQESPEDEGVPFSSVPSSTPSNAIVTAKPFDPLDAKRIQTIRDYINTITERFMFKGERREQLRAAVYAVGIGELNVTDAAEKFKSCYKSLTNYVNQMRKGLASILPPQIVRGTKIIKMPYIREQRREELKAAAHSIIIGELKIKEAMKKFNVGRRTINQHIMDLKCNLPSQASFRRLSIVDEMVTIDGVTVPKSILLLSQMITNGKLDYSKARPFNGTRDELREKVLSIIGALDFRGNIDNLVKCIVRVHISRDCTLNQAYLIYNVNKATLELYAKAVKLFIKKWQFPPDVTTENGRMEPPQLLPIPLKNMMNDCEMKKDEMKEGPI